VVTYPDPTGHDVRHFEGFEDPSWMPGSYVTQPSVDWNDYSSHMTRVLSGTNGITSKGGVAHADVDSTSLPAAPNDFTGIFSRLGGYSSVFGTGWYNTGDVVDISGNGLIRVIGRVRRFAKIAGEMVSLDTIEEIAAEASPAHRHAAILRTESTSGETTVLFTTDPELTRAGLMHTARARGGQELAVARRIVCVPEIPLLPSGKIDYVSLRTIQLDQPAANEAGAGPQTGQPMPSYEPVAARP